MRSTAACGAGGGFQDGTRPHAYFPSAFSRALRRDSAALARADQTARFLGSARYLRTYSRFLARLPLTRQASEQYTRGLPVFLPGPNALPQTRHFAGLAWAAGAEGLLPAALRRRRAAASFRHRSEQYRTERLVVETPLPHSPHRTRRTRAASLAALSLHDGQ